MNENKECIECGLIDGMHGYSCSWFGNKTRQKFESVKNLYLETSIQVKKEYPNRIMQEYPCVILTAEYALKLANFREARELLFENLCKHNNIEYIPVPKS